MAVSASRRPGAAARGAAGALAARAWTPRVALPVAFAFTAAWLAWQASHVNSYIWLIDELLYMKYAVSYSDFAGVMPAVHGQAYGAPNLLYALLASPLFWFLSAPDAFKAAHVLNGLLFASAILPVYLTARRAGATWPWALLGGLAAVWVPWAVASLVMMTEATAYPAFAWAVFGMTLSVADPRPRHDLLAVAGIALAVLARTQLVFLIAVLPLAILFYELARPEAPRLRERLRARRMLAGLALAGAAVVALVQVAGGNLLGSYEITTTTSLLPGGLWDGMMVHVAHLVIGVTVVPAVMWGAWLLVASSRPAGSAERAAAAVSALAFAAVIYQAGWFTRTVAGGVFQERYTLYAVALFGVGVAVLGSRAARPAPRASLLAATLFAAVAVAGSQFGIAEAAGAFGRVASAGAGLNERWAELQPDANSVVPGRDRSVTELLALFTLAAGIVLTVAFSAGRWRRVLVPLACVAALAASVAQTRWLFPRVITGIAQSYPALLDGVDRIPRDWVDRAAPDSAVVGLMPGRVGSPNDGDRWMWTEFWNKEVDREYTLSGAGPFTGWPGHRLKLDRATGRVETAEVPDLLLVGPSDPTMRLAGEVLKTSPYGVALMRPAQPLRAEWRLEGATFDGAPAGASRRLRLSVYRPSRRVALTLVADGAPPEAGPVRLSWSLRDARGTRRGTLRGGTRTRVVVEGRPAGGALSVAELDLPALRFPAGNDGTVRVLRIDPA
ncbi:MAG TPA: hypothetical protein VGW75_12300 [Solirubrobacteraceae bacterium]|nr:hypothetical protein [Solirubrobacteraceae bacterium]